MNKGTRIVIAVLAAVISIYVRRVILQSSQLVRPTIAAETVTVTSVDTNAMKLSLSLTVLNSNSRDLPVQDVAVKVALGGMALGGGYDSGVLKLPLTATLAAGKSTQVVVPVELPWKDSAVMFQLAATPEPVRLTAEGHVELAGQSSQLWVPFHVEGSVAHEQVQESQRGLLRGLMH
jgi:LEA14-like dessication related protein